MISAIVALIGGIISGSYVPLLSPVLYLSAKLKKEYFLILFFAYCMALSFDFELPNIYNTNFIIIFTLILPTILLLDAGLRGESVDFIGYAVLAISIISLFFREIYIIAVVIYLFNRFSNDTSKKSLIIVTSIILTLTTSLIIEESSLGYMGSASAQVTFISAITAIAAVIVFWKKRVKKVEFSL